jgi:hypothetical protein
MPQTMVLFVIRKLISHGLRLYEIRITKKNRKGRSTNYESRIIPVEARANGRNNKNPVPRSRNGLSGTTNGQTKSEAERGFRISTRSAALVSAAPLSAVSPQRFAG